MKFNFVTRHLPGFLQAVNAFVTAALRLFSSWLVLTGRLDETDFQHVREREDEDDDNSSPAADAQRAAADSRDNSAE